MADQRSGALAHYRQHLHQYLSDQRRDQLTQRALLGTVEQIYSAALDLLSALPINMTGVGVQRGRSDLTPRVLTPFEGFNRALLDAAVDFNRTSCAISNFGDEHDPGEEYLATISRDLAAAWREFAINTNRVLLAKIARVEESAPAA